MSAPKLWAVITSHSEVPGDHLILMCQPTEPTDKEVLAAVRRRGGYKKEDTDCLTVTHCYDVEHWLQHYDNRAVAARWITERGTS